jgi:hypothetical protein
MEASNVCEGPADAKSSGAEPRTRTAAPDAAIGITKSKTSGGPKIKHHDAYCRAET